MFICCYQDKQNHGKLSLNKKTNKKQTHNHTHGIYVPPDCGSKTYSECTTLPPGFICLNIWILEKTKNINI